MTASSDKADETTSEVLLQSDSQCTGLVLATVEVVLLSCGPILPKSLREKIEALVTEGLLCLCKGIMQPPLGNSLETLLNKNAKIMKFISFLCPVLNVQPWSSDRKVKRAAVELIRSDIELQLSLLRLASTEITSPYPDGEQIR